MSEANSVALDKAATIAAWLRSKLRLASGSGLMTLPENKLIELLEILDNKVTSTFRDLSYEEKLVANTLVTVELFKQGIMTAELPIQPEVCNASERCPKPYQWSCYDGMATEIEVLEFLHALVRMIKPNFVLETGTYLGHGAVYMALAMKKNGFGEVLSCDLDKDALSQAVTLAMQNEVQRHLRFVGMPGEEVIAQLDDRCLDMAFIDSGAANVRIKELDKVIKKLKYDAVVVVHDTGIYPEIEKHLNFKRLKTEIDIIHFPQTPRGLSIFTKV